MARSPLGARAAAVLRRRVGACLAYRGLARAGFVWPILVPLFAGLGELSPAVSFWLVAAYAAGWLAAARPAAGLAGRSGRRPLLIGAGAAGAVGGAVVVASDGAIGAAVGQTLLGVASAVRAIALPGLLEATLADFGQEDDAPVLEERARILETVVALAAAASSGVLLEAWSIGPYLFTSATAAGALACAVLLDEPRARPSAPARGEWTAALREIARAPALARPILFAAIAAAVALAVRFAQQPCLEALGVGAASLGLAAAGAGALRAVTGSVSLRGARAGWLAVPAAWIGTALVPAVALAALRHVAVAPLGLLRGVADGARTRGLDERMEALVAPAARPAAAAVAAVAARAGELVGAVGLALATGLAGVTGGLGLVALAAVALTALVAWLPLGPGPRPGEGSVDVVPSAGPFPPDAPKPW